MCNRCEGGLFPGISAKFWRGLRDPSGLILNFTHEFDSGKGNESFTNKNYVIGKKMPL